LDYPLTRMIMNVFTNSRHKSDDCCVQPCFSMSVANGVLADGNIKGSG